jgi:signal transduction histidine kinase
LEEIRARKLDIVPECYPDTRDQQRIREFIAGSSGEWAEFKIRVRDGRVIDTSWVNIKLEDGTSIGIGLDVTERKQALERLQATTTHLRALSANIQAGREEDRSRVARLIHDELGSAFSSLKWDLEALEKTIAKPLDSSEVARWQAKIASMLRLADGTIDTVRRIAWELRPSILDDLGLMEALEWQARQFETRTGIVCRRVGLQDNIRFSEEQSTAIFRIFQEALTNIIRHAHATRVDVKMTNDEGIFALTIRDNGKGITGVEKSGLGILGMQERARMLGGKLEIQGVEGIGTTITARLPLGTRELS